MRTRWLAAVAAVLAIGGAATAQQAAEPTVEVRLRSADDLINKAAYIAGLVGQEEAVKQVREIVRQLSADGKGIEGVDPKTGRPTLRVFLPRLKRDDAVDLSFLLALPNLKTPLAEGFREWGRKAAPASRRLVAGELRRRQKSSRC